MAHTHRTDRRHFLKLSARLAALGMTAVGGGFRGAGGIYAAELAQTTPLTDYKALVCVYLFGGNDGNNMIVPRDARYNAYLSLRGGVALGSNKLLAPFSVGSESYSLHYGMPGVNDLYAQGTVAFVLNTGQLDQPLTRAEYLAGQKTPTNLFSHSDQTVQAQQATSAPDGTGWGGRLLDCCGVTDSIAAISMSSPAVFLQGKNVAGNAIPPGVGLTLGGMNFWPQAQANSRRQVLNTILGMDGGNLVRKAANKSFNDGLQLADTLLANAGDDADLSFPGSAIGTQLKEVAKLIRVRSAQGPGRQVFFCSLGGFDLHADQDWTHWYLLSELSPALERFQKTMEDNLLSDRVTSFTQSEFGRTMQSTGSGSDHAWGSHQMVIGGAVKGGVYGSLPNFALGTGDDAGTRGVWIPKISTTQVGATLGKWFGGFAPDDPILDVAFPNLKHFTGAKDIGFMKP
jgi:uncharacterized protein (DUF1501 family)